MPFKLIRHWSTYRGICWWILVLGECAISITAQIWRGGPVLQLGYSSVLFGKQRKIHPRVMRWAGPKKERGSILAPHFMFFLLLLSLPYVNWASHEGCLFHLRVSLWFLDFLLFHFCKIFLSFFLSFFFFFFFLRFFFLCLLATTILDSFSLF